MGIPFYFVSLIKAHKTIVSRVRTRLEPNILLLDFNAFIHTYMDDARPIESILEALTTLLADTCSPRTHLYIAMDGLVPYAKIVQQRYRRFRIPEGNNPVFDRNQISPGTPYMKELDLAVRARFPQAIVSSTDLPGEGEHKLFEWLKTLPSTERTNTVIYGLDADLILLSLAQEQLCSLSLLRENPSFQSKTEGYSTLNISDLARKLPMNPQQYVALCVLCFGNDFMPPIGMFSLREGGHDRAIECYRQAGEPDLFTAGGRQLFLQTARTQEMKVYTDRMKGRDNPGEKAVFSVDGQHFEVRYNLHILDGTTNISQVVQSFWKTFHWTLHYFCKNECLDWNWVYPYPEAPLVSQIVRYEEIPIQWSSPPPQFTVTKQLQFILPHDSLRRAKKRVMFPDELYDEAKDTRIPWMRRYAWECEPRISLPIATEELTSVQSFQYSPA
uniref:Xrn1 N-terminal domain-containing protein n=1 Tax=viral metagenome TaxID=1070528 RepID=A0A6C0AJR4_9ZZZZ